MYTYLNWDDVPGSYLPTYLPTASKQEEEERKEKTPIVNRRHHHHR